jgi:hypothetical protein
VKSRILGLVPVLAFVAACSREATAPSSLRSASELSSVLGASDEVLSNAVIHRPLASAVGLDRAAAAVGGATTISNLLYHGGVGGIGVATAPKIYLVVWGSQWNGSDPAGELPVLQSFLAGIGGSSWLNSVTQYCQGIANGSSSCAGATAFAGNPTGMYAGIWYDNSAKAPSKPTQSQLAAEAVRAAAHFGNGATVNASAQYIIATASGNNSTGFKTQYCAYHSYTNSASTGNVAYTNLPYIPDAGASCGANFNGLGALAGVTMVAGHEVAETLTDQFPSGGWLDSGGAENGDKCAWIATGKVGASTTVVLTTGTFAVQSLWSNATASCVVSY